MKTKDTVLSFPLEEQDTSLVSEHTLTLLHASVLEIDGNMVDQVDHAVKLSQAIILLEDQKIYVPQSLLHDSIPFMSGGRILWNYALKDIIVKKETLLHIVGAMELELAPFCFMFHDILLVFIKL